MGMYRKKPVVIEARQIGEGPTSDIDIKDWCGGELTLKTSNDRTGLVPTISITTLEGVMWASVGDWVIKGVNGEFYPCKPDIFDATYEPAE